MHRRSREMTIVATHAHHFLLVRHRARGKRYLNDFAAEEERTDELPLWSHHLHSPGILSELRNGYQIVVFDKPGCFERQFANHLRLFAGLDIKVLHVLKSFLPVIAIAKCARSFFHLVLTPSHL